MIAGRAYPIRTDFRVAVRYAMAAMDGSLTEELFYRLWFPAERPEDLDGALRAVGLFYNLGKPVEGDRHGPIPYGFREDAGPIYAAFRRHYGLDLGEARLHWWQFRALLEGLITHSFRQRVGYRTADLRDRDAKERAEILRYRARYALEDRGEDLQRHLAALEAISQNHQEGK